MKLISCLALCLLLAGCFSSDSVCPRAWRAEELQSRYLRLVGPAGTARELRFTGPQTALATVGNGAAAVRTVLHWRIESDGALHFLDAQDRTFARLAILQVSAMHYTVTEGPVVRVYVLERWWE